MKTTKKLFALALALMMAFTTLVLPAAAAAPEDEGIEPLYVVSNCPDCNGNVREGTTTTEISYMNVLNCRKNSNSHDHVVYTEKTPYYCTSCSYHGTHTRSYMGDCA